MRASGPQRTQAGETALAGEIGARIDEVPSLDEDRILRGFLQLVSRPCAPTSTATIAAPAELQAALGRRAVDAAAAPALRDLRLRPRDGGHPPARRAASHAAASAGPIGREDYRTEVLGLMKAQMVKNAVIVPVGCKGGFVLKRPPADPGDLRDEVAASTRR